MAIYNPNSVSSTLGIAPACGLSPSRFVPQSLQSQAATVAQNNVPPGAPSDFVPYCTACLIARGIIYFKNVPGDCGSPTTLDFSSAQLTGQAGQVASGIAAMAGATLPGIGAAVTAIEDIFEAHAQAVANEQSTICKVAGIINQVFAYYDTLVAQGRLDPSSAYSGMQTFLAQANEQLQTIFKKCNAACVYQGILKAHAQFAQTYYPAIAPIQASSHAPGAPPAALGTVPGGVIQVGGGSTPAYGSTLEPEPQLAPVLASSGFSNTTLVLILAVLLAVFVIGFAVVKP
jgi:hypothetical protein